MGVFQIAGDQFRGDRVSVVVGKQVVFLHEDPLFKMIEVRLQFGERDRIVLEVISGGMNFFP